MLFNKSFVLSLNNWKVMLKALLCQILILALVTALCMMVFGSVDDIFEAFTQVEWGKFIADTFTSIGDGTFDGDTFAEGLKACIVNSQNAIESIPNIWNRVEVSYIIFVVIIVVYRLLISISDVAAAFQIHEFMTSNTSRPFTWFFVKKFRESLAFSALQMVITVTLDFLIVLGSLGGALMLLMVMNWWAVIPAGIMALFLYTARQTYFSFWLPVVTEEQGISASLTKSLSAIPYRFWSVFWKNLVILLLMVIISALSMAFIQNNLIKLIVCTVPNLGLFFLLKCVNMVEYFETVKHPYFYKKVDVEGTERFNKKMKRQSRKAK